MITTKIFTHFALTCAAVFALGAATMMTSCGKDDGGEEPAAGYRLGDGGAAGY